VWLQLSCVDMWVHMFLICDECFDPPVVLEFHLVSELLISIHPSRRSNCYVKSVALQESHATHTQIKFCTRNSIYNHESFSTRLLNGGQINTFKLCFWFINDEWQILAITFMMIYITIHSFNPSFVNFVEEACCVDKYRFHEPNVEPPLLPKLQGHFAEFLRHGSLDTSEFRYQEMKVKGGGILGP
jgi:hypothetical protein